MLLLALAIALMGASCVWFSPGSSRIRDGLWFKTNERSLEGAVAWVRAGDYEIQYAGTAAPMVELPSEYRRLSRYGSAQVHRLRDGDVRVTFYTYSEFGAWRGIVYSPDSPPDGQEVVRLDGSWYFVAGR